MRGKGNEKNGGAGGQPALYLYPDSRGFLAALEGKDCADGLPDKESCELEKAATATSHGSDDCKMVLKEESD